MHFVPKYLDNYWTSFHKITCRYSDKEDKFYTVFLTQVNPQKIRNWLLFLLPTDTFTLFLFSSKSMSWTRQKTGNSRKQHGGQWQCDGGYFWLCLNGDGWKGIIFLSHVSIIIMSMIISLVSQLLVGRNSWFKRHLNDIQIPIFHFITLIMNVNKCQLLRSLTQIPVKHWRNNTSWGCWMI